LKNIQEQRKFSSFLHPKHTPLWDSVVHLPSKFVDWSGSVHRSGYRYNVIPVRIANVLSINVIKKYSRTGKIFQFFAP
jgi:hypothetical protein